MKMMSAKSFGTTPYNQLHRVCDDWGRKLHGGAAKKLRAEAERWPNPLSFVWVDFTQLV